MKLQSKILLLVIPIVVLPLVWLGWSAYLKLKDNSQETSLRQMTILLDQVGLNTLAHLSTARANIELFAGSNLIKKYILTHDEADRYRLLQPSLMRLFASYQSAYPNYYEIRILMPDGYEDSRSTITRMPNITEYESDSVFFQQLQEANESVHISYTRNPDINKPVLYIGKGLILRDESFEPINTPPTLRGYLAISINLDFLQEQLDNLRISDNGYLFIADDSGRILMTPQNSATSTLSEKNRAQLQEALLNNEAIKIDYLGQPTYIQGYLLESGLQLFAVLPESDVLSASHTISLLVVTITLFSIIFASSLIFYVINRILIRPIQKLGRTAYEIGHGRFDTRTGINSHDEIGGLARSFEEMSQNLQESQDQVSYLAYHDSLTSLPNRHMFEEYLQRALSHARLHQTGLALLFLDLDKFKKVNDTMGHQAGDQLLQDLSERLIYCLREYDKVSMQKSHLPGEAPHDTLSRIGGDEFLILLPSIKDPSEAAIVAQRLLDVMAEPFIIRDNKFFIGGSIGISFYPSDGEDVQTLTKNADIAMYHAKECGRNNYQYFNESMNAEAMKRVTMENALRNAISQGELQLHYQPKVNMYSGEINGVEALIRWQHPEMGMVQPNSFIPLAEDSGLIVPIGEWVIDEATQQMRRWQDVGIDITMSVNISTVQLNKQNVAEIIKHYIKKNRCRAERLEIELTETSIMDAQEHAAIMLNDIKSLGVQISMDDFGVGYSSFSYLRNLPIDILKIDRSFVRDITTDQDDAAIISAIIAMAHTLNLVVVAEGVETLAQLDFLQKKKCDIVQGYLISRPLPEADLRESLLNRERLRLFDAEFSSQKGSVQRARMEIIKNK